MKDTIIDQAEQIVSNYARKDDSVDTAQRLVMRCQNPMEGWKFVSTTRYALPGRWVYVVLLWRDTGKVTEDGLREIRMKSEVVISEEGEGGKLEYLLKAPFDEGIWQR